MGKQRVVVVGSGMASVAVVEALLQRDEHGTLDISVLGAEPRGAYDRTQLRRILRGEGSPEQLTAHDAAWLERHGVHALLGVRARLIERVRRRVHGDGVTLPFDKLILAIGASAYLPPIRGLLGSGGGLHPGVFSTRSLDDCVTLASVAARSRRIAVLGGGELGLCALGALAGRHADTHLLEVAPRLLGDHLDDYGSDLMRSRAEAHGASVHLAARAKEILGDPWVSGLVFDDGTKLECDLLVLAAGGQPCTWLAFQSGLSVERGIVVDGYMRSVDDADVYALGACAQWRARVSTVPEEINRQADVIAQHVLRGAEADKYLGEPSGHRFELLGLDFFALGRSQSAPGDDVFLTSEPSAAKYKKLVWRRGRLVSALLVGDTQLAPDIEQLCAARVPVSRERQQRLLDVTRAPGLA
jgi:nitrite reductase (NADH) large subunit